MKLSKLHCFATHNTWANQRRKRREAAGKLRTRKQLLPKDPSESEQSDPSRAFEIDPEGLIKSNRNAVSIVNETIQRENLPAELASVSTSRIYNGVQDSGDVIAQKYPVALMTAMKHPATPEEETQNDEIPLIENNDVKSDNIGDKISETDRKRKHSSSPNTTKSKFLKSDDNDENKQVLLEFVLTLGAKRDDLVEYDDIPEMFLQMDWINGQDRNCMYQLFQYFKNRFNP